MARTVVATLLLAPCALALAADAPPVSEARRLAADPDRTSEALVAALHATEEAPADPEAFATLVTVVQAARGPTLDATGLREARIVGEAVEVTLVAGQTRGFDVTGGPASGRIPAVEADGRPSPGRIQAAAGTCTVSGVPDRAAVALTPCSDLAGGAVSPDGTRAVTVHATSRTTWTERLWDLDAATEVATLRTDVNPAGGWVARFSPDGRRLFTYDNAGMRPQPLYDPASGEVVAVLGPVQRDGRFTPDGRRLVLADVDLQSFDADDGVLVSRLAVDGDAWKPRTFLADGRHLAVAHGEWTSLWDVVDGGVTELVGAWDNRGSDGRHVLVGRPLGPVRVVDTGPAEAVAVLGTPGWSPRAVAVSADGGILAAADAERVAAWTRSGETLLDAEVPHVRWLALSGGRLVASTGDVWDLRGGALVAEHVFRYLEEVTPGPDGRVAYAWDRTGSPPSRFRDLVSGETIARLPKDVQVRAEAGGPHFSADGTRFAGAVAPGLGVYNVSTGRRLTGVGDGTPYARVVLSADGSQVAGQAEGSAGIDVFEVDTGQRRTTVRAGTVPVALALSADGTRLAAGDAAGRVALHNANGPNGRLDLAGHVGGIETLAWSQTGDRLLSAGGGEVRLWDATTGILLAAWPAATPAQARFTAGGTLVAHLGPDGTVQVQPATVAGYREVACRWLAHHPAGASVRAICAR